MTQNSPKKGPGHVLTLFEYNIPSKKDQATIHNSFKKGPGHVLTLLEYNIPLKKGPSHDTELPQKRTRLLLKFLPKTLISHADRMYRLRVGFDKIGQEFSTIDLVGEHLLTALHKSFATFCICYSLFYSNPLSPSFLPTLSFLPLISPNTSLLNLSFPCQFHPHQNRKYHSPFFAHTCASPTDIS